MQQYFLSEIAQEGKRFCFSKEQSNHIQKVMRMNEDSIVKVVDVDEQPFYAKIKYANKEVFGEVVECLVKQEETVKITLIQGMIKKEKWEFLIQKCCELGVDSIVPMISSRTIVKVDNEDKKKLERYNKIALEACEQCKRDHLVKVSAPIRFKMIPEYKSELNVIAYEAYNANSIPLKQLLREHPNVTSITYVIGSEGGFSEEEVQTLQAQGFRCVSLGNRILRAETAAMVVVNASTYELE